MSSERKSNKSNRPRARSSQNRENQLISMAYDLAEERLRDKTATAQEIVHFLKMGAMKTQLEKQKLETEAELLRSKKDMVDSAKRTDEKYQEVMDAIRAYHGVSDE